MDLIGSCAQLIFVKMAGHQSIATRTEISKMKNSFYKQSWSQLLILFGGISNVALVIYAMDWKYAGYIVLFTCVYHFLTYFVLMNWNYWWARHINCKAAAFIKNTFPTKQTDIWGGCK